ncbi:hypothetical protein BOX15_Mlig009343g3 [Macrostomum lignano]|uniref:Large ribosomal subunit protein P1 n=1 Tax=Macrostomum lignano TaxID=282301 RepID=A0A267G194_9PLAT|nr:hypothetical protein BOX15_Mlig018921g2 [Macrostomum lignano]PAA79773.1 hypothetical protein BOX15_Mlig009343g3 [Macrostomum lignano]
MAHDDKEGQSELACTYAALILADDDIPVTADKISAILKAANIHFVEPFWPNMFARALEKQDLKQLLFSAGVGAGGAAGGEAGAAAADGAGAGAAAAAPEKKEEKKPESESESDDDMGLDLFG